LSRATSSSSTTARSCTAAPLTYPDAYKAGLFEKIDYAALSTTSGWLEMAMNAPGPYALQIFPSNRWIMFGPARSFG
jgi:hypothetical protein